MTITRNNYEIYLIDFIDGALSPELKEELMFFLKQNPDIAYEAEDLSEMKLEAEQVEFSYPKEMLKRSGSLPQPDISQADYLCIAEFEGDITPSESDLLKDIKNRYQPIRKLLSIYYATKLIPEVISFQQKEPLKRSGRVVTLRQIYVASAVAAAVVLLFLIGSLIFSRQMVESPEMMANQSPVAIEQSQLQSSLPLADQEEATSKKVQHQNIRSKRDEIKTVKEDHNSTYIDNSTLQPLAMQLPKPISDIPQGPVQNELHLRNDISVKIYTASASARELTLSDLAAMGLRRLAKGVGIDVEVKVNPDQTKRIIVESKLLALSATISPKEE